jgi:hypothetical protein
MLDYLTSDITSITNLRFGKLLLLIVLCKTVKPIVG